MSAIGMLLGFSAFYVFGSANNENYFGLTTREIVLFISIVAATVWSLTILVTTYGVREQSDYSGRGGRKFTHAYRDVFRNKHARLILFIHTVHVVSISSLSLLAAIVLGFFLQWVGFAPNVEQSQSTLFAILFFVGAVPAIGHFAGAFLFRKFSLDEATYIGIRQALQERSANAAKSAKCPEIPIAQPRRGSGS